MKKSGRSFDCNGCPEATQKLRRCKEDREDFESPKDGNFWPIRITKKGTPYSFCPGKATWCEDTAESFRLLETTYYLRQPLFPGSFMEQPWWYAELIYEVLPLYEAHREAAKHRAQWGSGDSGGKKGDQNTSNGGTSRQGKPKRRKR